MMNTKRNLHAVALCGAVGLSALGFMPAHAADKHAMSFFISSTSGGKGGDLGGLAGADKLCQSLAEAAGAGKKTWRAYLSAQASGGTKAVNARDRIGKGPWYNAKGELIAKNVDELHRSNNLTKQTALTEKGDVVNGRGDKPNLHDILTGTDSMGMAFGGSGDTTCSNWTSSSTGSAMVGHHDRQGLNDLPPAKSWVQSHASRGCSPEALAATGGGGFVYCFATR